MYEKYKALAYVTVPASENWRWIGREENGKIISDLDTDYVTHINFAFGMIKSYRFEEGKYGCPLKIDGDIVDKEAYRDTEDNEFHYRVTLNGWIEEMDAMVDGREYLKALVALKTKKPEIKILLSIGGWDSDGFCYMAKTQNGRQEFADSCVDIINEYGIDGIDIDWEFPENGGWGKIACCETCVQDAVLMLKTMRETLENNFTEHKILSIASGCGAAWLNAEGFQYLDYMNIMCYDFFEGKDCLHADFKTAGIFVKDHMDMIGDTAENRQKVNIGVPFYNDAGQNLVPYFKEYEGRIDANPEITLEKMNRIKEQGFGGGFYWAYGMDKFEVDTDNPDEVKVLQRAVYNGLNK